MLPLTKKDPRFKQGVYFPQNKQKCQASKAIYRSGLELKFFRFCGTNPNVLKWASESVIIPYFSKIDKKVRRYYVDNYVEIKEGDKVTKYLIEIKPDSQTRAPKTKYRKTKHLVYEQNMFVTNQCKWQAAEEYAEKHGMKFKILTEKDLG